MGGAPRTVTADEALAVVTTGMTVASGEPQRRARRPARGAGSPVRARSARSASSSGMLLDG